MKLRHMQSAVLIASLVVAALSMSGCGTSGTTSQPSQKSSAAADDHSGWWCVEHGVPEAECSVCSSKAAAQFKAKGDWCGEHNRAESQCFACDPKRADKFAALYEAKFGKKPPKPTE